VENQEDTQVSEIPVEQEGEQALVALRKELETAQKEVLYIKAEFENYRKRIIREQEQAIKFANKNLISDLLNIVDYLDRAIQHSKILKSKADAELTNFVSGVEMSQHEFVQLLGRFGVEFVGSVGEAFDPEKHEAIGQKEVSQDLSDKVVEVLQRGSVLNGRLIKPAKVVVGKS
jgi:molecular chaperone GrpE